MRYLRNEVDELHRDKVRIQFIGRRDRFSRRINALFERSESLTRGNSGSTLVIAVDYGGHWDIAGAARRLAERVQNGSLNPADITPELLGSHLSTGQLPPPDLCIRTGGDSRVSNFMLWQFAYTELFFTDTLWPDFNEQAFESALRDFRMRERRFGGRPGLDNNNA
jgi:undecaprenyl diphosphate synthase